MSQLSVTRKYGFFWILCFAMMVVFTGCAGSSTFFAYPDRINPMIDQVKRHTPPDVSKCNECEGSDRILHSMERGRISQLSGNTDLSKKYFKTSIDEVKANDEKATISASSVGANIAATAVNDNAIPYEGDGYERVMLHHYQGINYLLNNDPEGAGVEFRLANNEQDESLRRFEKDVEKARQDAEEKKASNAMSAVESRYAQLDEMAGKVKNSFQNAYSFYLSGVVYEILKQPNDAYIDYKKALEIYPENKYLQKDVLRLAAVLDMRDDLNELSSRFKIEPASLAVNAKDDAGELLVLFEDDFIPQKKEFKIPLPIPRVGIVALAFPTYNIRWSSQPPLQLSDNSQPIGQTEPICDFRALAAKALKEKIPVITARQVVRAIAKGATAKAAKDNGGLAGELIANIWNIVSENADLRSWLTLPADAQIMRVSLPAGVHNIVLQQEGVVGSAEVEIPAKGEAILHVVRVGNQFYVKPIVFPFVKQQQAANN